MKVAEIEPGQVYAVLCKNLDRRKAEPDGGWLGGSACILGHPGDGERSSVPHTSRRLHRCRVISLRQPYAGTSQGVEVEGDFRTVETCTCERCGSEHPARVTAVERYVVHPVHIECPWDQAVAWMEARGWSISDDERKRMTD